MVTIQRYNLNYIYVTYISCYNNVYMRSVQKKIQPLLI